MNIFPLWGMEILCSGNVEPQPLDCQGIPKFVFENGIGVF